MPNPFRSSVIIIDINPGKLIQKPFYGSILRGWFGSLLKCDPRKKCFDCQSQTECPYFMVFKNPNDIKPYSLMSIPNNGHIRNMIKIYGEQRSFIPQILEAIYNKGRTSHFGGSHFVIESVEARDMSIPDVALQERTSVVFVTPTCIKRQNTMEMLPSFESLLRSSVRAYNRISKFYDRDNYPLRVSDAVLASSAPVETFDVRAVSVTHESMDERRIQLEGIVGSVTYNTKGVAPEAGSILKMGEYLQIGKHSTYGLGGFIMKSEGKEL